MQVLPTLYLSSVIKHYLLLDCKAGNIKKYRLFSDGNIGLVFSFGNNVLSNISDYHTFTSLPKFFIYGQINDYQNLYLPRDISLIIVVFQPTGFNKLMKLPAYHLKDSIIGADAIFGKQIDILYEQLFNNESIDEKLYLLNNFFTQLIVEKSTTNQLIIQESINTILRDRGLISIQSLKKIAGYSERHFERSFSECVGLSPKKFCDIVQLHYFVNRIKSMESNYNLTRIAYESGYFDQSHSIRKFKQFTGITPKEYLSKSNRLTINLLEL